MTIRTGTAGNDVLTGGAGDDTLSGLDGNDRLVGQAGHDVLNGGNGNDRLDGGTGADTMRGGGGDDVFYVDDSADVVIENDGEGTDIVLSSVSYRLRDYIENLTLTGTAIRATGNDSSNGLVGNAGNNILDGRGGADTMRGGAGNDSYYVDNSGDRAIENSGEGADRVYSSVSYRLAANVEDLHLTGSAVRATGNSEDNRLYGNSGDNILDGLGGGDIMQGGAGNDTYYVDDHYDEVTEYAGEGRDIVFSSISYHLGSQVEDLILTGTAANGIGNNLGNIITGNALDNTLLGGGGNDSMYGGDGRDVLNGGTGADTMTGGAGVDTYYVDNLGDVITEAGGSDDSSIAMVSVDNYVLPANVDEGFVDSTAGLTLTANSAGGNLHGNIGDDTLIGQTGNDNLSGFGGLNTLYGGAGNDTLDSQATDASDLLYGGTGDDLYRINLNSSGFVPVITEYANEGHDEVDVSFSTASSYTLTLNVEDGVMGSTAGSQLHGNAASNALTDYGHLGALYGGDGSDSLTGGAQMYGEAGNDTCVAADVDTSLSGGTGSDTLRGGAGIDQLSGDAGSDTLTGGSGFDTFIYTGTDLPGDIDLITDFHSSVGPTRGAEDDTLDLSAIDANSLVGGDQAFNYIGTSAFSGTAGELRADVTSSSRGLSYHLYGDMNGDGVADFQVILHVIGTALYSDDIVF